MSIIIFAKTPGGKILKADASLDMRVWELQALLGQKHASVAGPQFRLQSRGTTLPADSTLGSLSIESQQMLHITPVADVPAPPGKPFPSSSRRPDASSHPEPGGVFDTRKRVVTELRGRPSQTSILSERLGRPPPNQMPTLREGSLSDSGESSPARYAATPKRERGAGGWQVGKEGRSLLGGE